MSTTDTPTMTVADAARLAADYIDSHDWPDGVELSISVFRIGMDASASVTVGTIDTDALIAARRLVGPVQRREHYGGGLYFRAQPCDVLTVRLDPPAEVCERVQVGTREVPVYETRCPESVLALGSEVGA